MAVLVRVDVDQLQTTAQSLRELGDMIQSTHTSLWKLGLDFAEGHYAGNLQKLFRATFDAVFDSPAKQISQQAEQLAQRLEQLAQRMQEADQLPQSAAQQQFAAWREAASWSLVQNGDTTMLKTASGTEIDLMKVVEGDEQEIEKYLEFINHQAATDQLISQIKQGHDSPEARFMRGLETPKDVASGAFPAAEEFADGQWKHVDGYLRQNGTSVKDYWRRFPGGKNISDKLGTAGNVIDGAFLSYAIHDAVTNNNREPIRLPLGFSATGEPITFNYTPPDKWRAVAENVGGIAGGVVGAAKGAATGAAAAGLTALPTVVGTGPAAAAGGVVGGVIGGVGGGKAGEVTGAAIYDRIFNDGEGAEQTHISYEDERVCADIPLHEQNTTTLSYTINEHGEPVISYQHTPK